MFPNPFTWLAGKLAGPVLAAIGIAAVVVAGVQTVRLDGFHLLGWTVHEGALDREAAANKRADALGHDLDVCHASNVTLQDALGRQNKWISDNSAADSQRLKDAAAAVTAAQNATNALLAKLRAFGATPPQGKDTCERVKDVDTRFLETLK